MWQLLIRDDNKIFVTIGSPCPWRDARLWLRVLHSHFGAEVQVLPVPQ